MRRAVWVLMAPQVVPAVMVALRVTAAMAERLV
jgi:hypothetical protein